MLHCCSCHWNHVPEMIFAGMERELFVHFLGTSQRLCSECLLRFWLDIKVQAFSFDISSVVNANYCHTFCHDPCQSRGDLIVAIYDITFEERKNWKIIINVKVWKMMKKLAKKKPRFDSRFSTAFSCICRFLYPSVSKSTTIRDRVSAVDANIYVHFFFNLFSMSNMFFFLVKNFKILQSKLNILKNYFKAANCLRLFSSFVFISSVWLLREYKSSTRCGKLRKLTRVQKQWLYSKCKWIYSTIAG